MSEPVFQGLIGTMNDERYMQLIRRSTSSGFDIDTAAPSEVQVESARDGVMHISEYEFDDDGYVSESPRDRLCR